jgi:hypothetical protein
VVVAGDERRQSTGILNNKAHLLLFRSEHFHLGLSSIRPPWWWGCGGETR